jgi:hypothetical protein
MDKCAICLEEVNNIGIINSCDHKYCYDCIKRWSKETNKCPQCKKKFTKITRFKKDQNKKIKEDKNKKRKINEISEDIEDKDLNR